MKKVLLFTLLLISASYLFAQTELTLNNLSSVNAQIEADRAGGSPADVYIAEAGVLYYWDATLSVNYDLHIKGSDSEWITKQASPAIFVPIPDDAGTIHIFADVTGGSYKVENILFSGINSVEGGEILGSFMTESGATSVIVDNCSFSDFQNSIMEIGGAPDLVSITNCIMINGFRRTSSPWGGHLGRFNVMGDLLVIENNTYVNSGRILGNGGEFYETKFIENHNTWLNAQTNAQELHWWEGLMSNNIFYNWSWLGRTSSDVAYNYSITSWETFEGLALDSVSVYFGRNLLYRDPAIKEYYDNVLIDSAEVMPYLCWNDDVDTTIWEDDNFTIGKSYWDIDPEFKKGPENFDKMMDWLYFKYVDNSGGWPDWTFPSPITYDADGQPVVLWPPDLDLSYTNEYMLEGATDGLPMGDLNWFPDKKADYLANRESYLDALRDSIYNATCLYIPEDSLSNRITEEMVSVEKYDAAIPAQFSLGNNYPNPFNPTTKINFELPQHATVTLGVFNILGQKVYEVTQKDLAAGSYTFDFDASKFSSGVYIYRLSAMGIDGQKFISSKKMTLMK